MIGRTRFARSAVAVLAMLALAAGPAGSDPAADLAAARRFRVAKEWAASESLATRALSDLTQSARPDSLGMADALELIANARMEAVGYADTSAQKAAGRSLAIRQRMLGPDHLDVAAAHVLLSEFLESTGRTDSALVHAQRALDIRTKRLGADDTLVADTWDRIALIHREAREFRPCLDAWTRAIEIRRRFHGPDHPEIARLIGQTGVPWMELGDLDRARQALEESLDMFARTVGPDAEGRWVPLNILGDLENRSGNVARDLDLLQEALRIVRIHYGENSPKALTLKFNISAALFDLGDVEGSQALKLALLPLYVAQYGPNSPRTLTVRLGLAFTARALQDTVTAGRQLTALEAYCESKGGRPEWLYSTALGQHAEILMWQHHEAEALAMVNHALKVESSGRHPEPSNLALCSQVRVQVLIAMGDTAALDSARNDLLAIGRRSFGQLSTPLISVAYWSARAAHRLGRFDEAWAEALEAEQTSRERLRLNLQALPDRRALLLTTREERYLDLALDYARDRGPAGLAIAWDRLVRSRGLVRAEIARRELPRALEADSTATRALHRWLDAQGKLARAMVTGDAPKDSAARARLDHLREAADDAGQAYARLLSDRGASLDTAQVGLAAVRARLKPDQALVACYELGTAADGPHAGDTRTVIALIARGGDAPVEQVVLGRSTALSAALDPWLERLAVSPGPGAGPDAEAERECRRRGRTVRALTWDRLAPHLRRISNVFLVADGPLVDLPWQALPEGAKQYLVEAGPRVHLLHAERELVEPAAPDAASLLALGAPDFDFGGTSSSAVAVARVRSAPDPCADPVTAHLAPLPGSGAEAEAVGRVWRGMRNHDATVLTGRAATEDAFKRLARGRAVLHLATHGVVAGDICRAAAEPLRGIGAAEPIAMAGGHGALPVKEVPPPPAAPRTSFWTPRRVSIALAGANLAREHTTDENEGLLTAEEVATLDLAGTGWVVLSACHSGVAERWSHEGTLGLRRAFSLAGARTVIASQWAVEDDATREWMQALYAERAHGATVAAAAMEAASRTVLAARRKAGRSTHPFYWAAFSATGE